MRVGGDYKCLGPKMDEALPHRDFVTAYWMSSSPSIHECGLRPDGRLECWGFRDPIRAADGVEPLVSAAMFDYEVMCGVRAEGSLACWHSDDRSASVGELVDLDEWTAEPARDDAAGGGVDRPLSSGGPFSQVYSVSRSLCALSVAGEVSCWWSARLGEDPPEGRFVDVPEGSFVDVPEGRFVDVAVGVRHGCGIREDGTVACWGEDFDVTDVGVARMPRVP